MSAAISRVQDSVFWRGWDSIRDFDTCVYGNYPNGAHESLTRAYHILREVKEMLARSDSPETIRTFIAWAEADSAPRSGASKGVG